MGKHAQQENRKDHKPKQTHKTQTSPYQNKHLEKYVATTTEYGTTVDVDLVSASITIVKQEAMEQKW